MVPATVRVLDPVVMMPFVKARLFSKRSRDKVTPVELLTVSVLFNPKVMVPVPLILWEEDPLKVRLVTFVAFPKVRIPTEETEIFPLITTPPEKSQLIVPFVIV